MRAGSHHSWCVKKILSMRSVAKLFVSYTVGNGTDIYLWHDPWLRHESLLDRYGTKIFSITDSRSSARLSDFILNGEWILPTSNLAQIMDLRSFIFHHGVISNSRNDYLNLERSSPCYSSFCLAFFDV